MPKTGLFSACLSANVPGLSIVPVAIAYDVVLEDRILARQGVKRRQRAFSRELAEMVRYAVGYRSRAFITFGHPIPIESYDESRRSVLDLAQQVRRACGRLYKVVPTAVLASAMRPSITRADLISRIAAILDTLRAVGANLAMTSAEEVLATGVDPLEARGVILVESGRFRVRDRYVLRYYARSIEHLLAPAGSTH
jgi:glycerol-3-phosphate O-acyltransferase